MTFIKDLLRRRVLQVMAVYIGAWWGLVEFVDFAAQRFALSPHLVDLALIGPLLLLPSVILVTYFHGAPGHDQWVRAEKIGIPINLLVAAVFLVLFFRGKDLGAATTTVTVTDEEGVETERLVPKDEFRRRLTVYYFSATPADTAAGWLRYGLPVAVQNDLAQDHFIDLRGSNHFAERLREAGFESLVDIPLPLARGIAEEMHRDHFVMGNVSVVDGTVRAKVSLFETGRGRLVEEREFSGTDILELADRISTQLRDDLKIPDLGEEGARDLPIAEILTHSPAAYRLSIESAVAMEVERDFALGTSLMEAAVAEDPTYAGAQSSLANIYLFTNRAEEAQGPMQAAMDHIYRLPERDQFVVKSNYYFVVRQDMQKAMASLEMWADLFPDDILAYQALLQIQTVVDDKDGVLASLRKILELDPNQKDVLLRIGDLHRERGEWEAAEEAFQEYAAEFPGNTEALARLGELSGSTGSFDQARDYYDRAMVIDPSDVGLMVGLGSVLRSAGDFGGALSQLEEALDAAGTPEERAQALTALEAYYLQRGQMGQAVEQMERRLAEASTFQPALVDGQQRVFSATTYAEAGREEEAFALVEEARAQLPPPFDGMALLGELDILLVQEDADAAEERLPEIEAWVRDYQLEIFRPRIVRAQGAVQEIRGAYQAAIERYREEQRLSPPSAAILMRLGRCHRGLGEFRAALSLLQESLETSPFGPRLNYETALTYEAMGRMDEARTHLDRALEVWAEADPEYRWARRAREAAERIGS